MSRTPPEDTVQGARADRRRIVVVGVCASGKTELVERLRARGYDAHQCAQEHSYVPTMWQQMARPDVLIYLEASRETVARRLERDFSEQDWQEQRRRLAHAAMHADLIIGTDDLTPDEVFERVSGFLRDTHVGPGSALKPA